MLPRLLLGAEINIVKLFPPVLADGLSLESKWQQVSASLQDSSLYPINNAVVKRVSACPPISNSSSPFPVSWGYRIHRLHLCSGFSFGLVWFGFFGFFVLMAYQLFLGYLMPNPFS